MKSACPRGQCRSGRGQRPGSAGLSMEGPLEAGGSDHGWGPPGRHLSFILLTPVLPCVKGFLFESSQQSEIKYCLPSFCRRGNGLRGHLAGVVVVLLSTKYFRPSALWHKAGWRGLPVMLGVACDILSPMWAGPVPRLHGSSAPWHLTPGSCCFWSVCEK